tara:strand:- start:111 stop:359 length:249 start_codon:yes stop_codon:yes gene_type:complete
MKTFEFLTKANKWQAIVDNGYADKKKSGVPCRIIHENGSWKVIANVDAIPEGMDTRFKAEPVPTLKVALENLAKTGQTVLPA